MTKKVTISFTKATCTYNPISGTDFSSFIDSALLLPSYVKPEEAEEMDETKFWVAKIRDIRSRTGTDDDVRSSQLSRPNGI
jgi:hypothetical protein